MKNIASYISILGVLSIAVIVLIDNLIMPAYVRQREGRYMVNVVNKSVKYAKKVLASEGYRSLISDTLWSSFA